MHTSCINLIQARLEAVSLLAVLSTVGIVLSGRGRHLDKAIRRPNRSNSISGFAFVDVAAFRRSKSMSKPNFVDISQLMAEI